MVFEGTTGVHELFIFSIPNEYEKRRNMRIRNGFEEFFCLRSNLSNDKIISAHRPGLKTSVENYIFWSEIGSGFGEQGGNPPPRIPRSTPRESHLVGRYT